MLERHAIFCKGLMLAYPTLRCQQSARQCRYAESAEICERVLHLNPLHFACLAGKGLCHRCLRQDAEAIACFEGAIAIHPYLNEVRSQLAEMKAPDKSAGDGI